VKFFISRGLHLNRPVRPSETFDINAKLTLISGKGYESDTAIYMGKGEFLLSVGALEDDVEYGIRIKFDGNTYESALSKPLFTPEIDSVSWSQPERNGPVYFYVSTHDNTSDEAISFLWKYSEIWEFHAKYYTTVFMVPGMRQYYIIEPAPYYYCWKYIESNRYIIGSTKSLKENSIINKLLFHCYPGEKGRFTELYCLNAVQKTISKNAYDFFQNKIKLNEEMGGLFTPQPSEISGNITCMTDPDKKAMGYITVSKNITQKQIWIYPPEISHPPFPSVDISCPVISISDMDKYLTEKKIYFIDFVSSGFVPSGDMKPWEIDPFEWAPPNCTNCVLMGGSKKKPDFWPNDHE